jgi:Ca-activated chloride channel family protein
MTTTDEPLAHPAVAGRLGDAAGLLPLVAVEIEAAVSGMAATTIVRQTFRNARQTSIEATYIFPLPDRAGVTAFTASLAGRLVEGELRERAEARAEYDAAIAAGHRAAITEEERSDVFSIRVGNLQPGEEAVITLTLTGPLSVDDGVAEYRFPLVVAPRYVAGQPLPWPPVGLGTAADTDAAPDASRITSPVLLPGLDSPVRLSLRARLAGLGLAPGDVQSSLHAVTGIQADGDAVQVSLQPGERLDRDVVLRFPVAAAAARAIAAVAPDEEDPATGTWQVTVVPPVPGNGQRRARDVIVVLDRSGSMGGWKIAAARRAAARVVDSLSAADRFAVLAFDHVVEGPYGYQGLVPASDRNRWAAVSWLAGLEARGGTEMLSPLHAAATALARAAGKPARDRFLVLVTDGQVAAEDQILAAVAPVAGDTRIFALGIDQAVNAGFLRRLAALGGGRCELVESEDRLDEVMASLHRRITPPVVTGLRVDADGVELIPEDTTPSRTPDLFPGAPCTLSGRWRAATSPAEVTLTVSGDSGFREQVAVAAAPDPAARTGWARARVRDLEDTYAAAGASPGLADQIVAVSLAHCVLSRFTAFVAVDRSRRTDLGVPPPVIQPVEQPSGWAAAGPAPMPMLARGGRAVRARALPLRASARPASGGSPLPPDILESAAELEAGPDTQLSAWTPLMAYLGRASDLFDRIEQDLAAGHDLGPAAEAVEELAADLSSVAAPESLTDVLGDLASALRGPGDPRAALAAARWAFFPQQAPSTPGPGRPGSSSRPGPRARRQWWR